MKNIVLPKELQDKLQKNKKMCMRIKAKKETTNVYSSKFGGVPYFPKDNLEYPLSKEGEPLRLLAQINFEEIPDNSIYPKKGILQFYISPSDDVHGLDFDNGMNQDKFRVIYFKDIIYEEKRLLSDFNFVNSKEEEYFPIKNELKLYFSKENNDIGIEDYQFEKLFGISPVEIENEYGKAIEDYFNDNFLGEGHKIGGYAYFTQGDPREYTTNYQEHSVLLLQIDSDDKNDIWWGDSGIANFFITDKDLKALDFTRVLYNWDCC